MSVLPDGRFLIGGFCRVAGILLPFFCASRHLPNGTLDPTFGRMGIATTSMQGPFRATPQFEGRIVGAGVCGTDSAPSSVICVTRLTYSGTVDLTYGAGGKL